MLASSGFLARLTSSCRKCILGEHRSLARDSCSLGCTYIIHNTKIYFYLAHKDARTFIIYNISLSWLLGCTFSLLNWTHNCNNPHSKGIPVCTFKIKVTEYNHGKFCCHWFDSLGMGGRWRAGYLDYSPFLPFIWNLKTNATAFRALTPRWLETCEKDKEAEEAKKTHDSNRCDPLLDQWKCSIGLLREDCIYFCKENDRSC